MSPRISRLSRAALARAALPRAALAAAAFAVPAFAAVPCAAQEPGPGIAYLGGAPPSYYGQAGYGANLLDGSYVGAPLTRFPSPREIVPSPWGYGTYGVPTVSGIRRAPVGEPVVYVVEGSGPRRGEPAGARTSSAGRDGRWSGLEEAARFEAGGGARVVQVRVPRR